MKISYRNKKQQPIVIINPEIELPIHVYIEHRKNSRVSIVKKSINIRLPIFLSKKQQENEIVKWTAWAKDRLNERNRTENNLQRKNYWEDKFIELFDGKWILEYKNYNHAKEYIAKVDSNNRLITFKGLFTGLKVETINCLTKELLIKIFKKHYYNSVFNLLTQINDKTLNESFNSLKLKYVQTRWGSCSSKKNINISIRLLFAPKSTIEYVLLHELAHLKEMNHSPRFWNIVAIHMPDYKKHEKWLKENSRNCDF